MSAAIETLINGVVQPIAGAAPNADGVPYATHSGVLELVPGLKLNVYRLSTGQAIVDAESMQRFLAYMGFSEAA